MKTALRQALTLYFSSYLAYVLSILSIVLINPANLEEPISYFLTMGLLIALYSALLFFVILKLILIKAELPKSHPYWGIGLSSFISVYITSSSYSFLRSKIYLFFGQNLSFLIWILSAVLFSGLLYTSIILFSGLDKRV